MRRKRKSKTSSSHLLNTESANKIVVFWAKSSPSVKHNFNNSVFDSSRLLQS